MTSSPRTVVLDAEALSALAERRAGMAERIEAARRGDQRVVVPAVVVAEVMTGRSTDASVWHVLARLPVQDLDVTVAARAGALRAAAEPSRRKKRDLTVDAIVAATALEVAPAVVLTSDVPDLRLLVGEADVLVADLDD